MEVMALTPTGTKSTRNAVVKELGMVFLAIVCVSPRKLQQVCGQDISKFFGGGVYTISRRT